MTAPSVAAPVKSATPSARTTKPNGLHADLGAVGRQCDHSICPTRKEGPIRRRLLFVTALAIILVAGLATTASRPAEAAFPGMNGKIAFTSGRDGNLEVHVMNADGSNQVNISQNAAVDSQPAWSADGVWQRGARSTQGEGSPPGLQGRQCRSK
jgi:hypothetical protein